MDNGEAYQKLKQLVSIQSVSTDPKGKNEMTKAAEYLKKELVAIGMDVALIEVDGCPPLVVGKKTVSKSAKTIGVYAHYDVQPEDPVDKWESPPFELTHRGNKLFGRGVADDKMHIVQSIMAVKNLVDKNLLKNNIIFVFEGEEERESDHFEDLVSKANSDLSKADVFYILDVGMKARNIPQIFYGLRGIGTFTLEIKAGTTDLHSGVYGNRVINPAQVAAELFSKMKDPKGRVLIPGFYDNVKKFSNEEIAALSKYVTDPAEERKNAGVKEMAAGFLESKIKPSLEINGISSGYTGIGFKTIIPAAAIVKFSVRSVEHQVSHEIEVSVKKFVAENMPKGVDYELETDGISDPFYTDFKNDYANKTAKILGEVFGNECLFNRSGGSIAAAEILQRMFAKPIILTGFTLPDENIHAPNENIDIEMFDKGITALEKIFSS
jgi:acetylornithine deacetylase/succinyl-diaminopimelate desuccinylase-like protein